MRILKKYTFTCTFVVHFDCNSHAESGRGTKPKLSNTTATHKMGVKIISPSKNSTVPAGQLIINGISSDTLKTNCKVFVDWNDLKPMQNVSAKGSGGPNDYSNWTYTYNQTYHNITAGINELTSKITCYDNPSNITTRYYSVNVTGS